MNRIETHFQKARKEGRKSLIMFLTAGFPDLAATEKIITVMDEAGADILELGVPFSDPLADGPAIQAASTEALAAGTTLEKILDLVAQIRKHSRIPILLFGAYNPFYHYGPEALVKKAVEAGVDGFLIPDLPFEEAEEFEPLCRKAGLSLIYLAAPTTPVERKREIARHSTGFLYYISLKGVTGTAVTVSDELRQNVEELRAIADPLPVAIGFGVQTPEHVRQLAPLSDAVVVGTALIRLIGQNKGQTDLLEKVREFVKSLKSAM